MRTRPAYRPTLTGRVLHTDDEDLCYQVLAVSANRSTALLRRLVYEGDRLQPTNVLATVPVHRISTNPDYIEPGPWLAVFPALDLAPAALATN